MAQNQGKSGENRKESTNKEYGRQGKYAKGNKQNRKEDDK